MYLSDKQVCNCFSHKTGITVDKMTIYFELTKYFVTFHLYKVNYMSQVSFQTRYLYVHKNA